MTMPSDEQLTAQLIELYREADLPIGAEVTGGVAQLSGLVSSPEMHQAAIDLARMVDGIVDVDDQLDTETFITDPDEDEAGQDVELRQPGGWEIESEEASIETQQDFAALDVGPHDFQRSVEEAEPYFPPTDPVLRPTTDDQEIEVIGGFQSDSMQELATREDAEPGDEPTEVDQYRDRDDEDIRDDVARELREDALTTDLELSVTVIQGAVFLRGTVASVDDAENAEAVAGRVPGVTEVHDLTQVEGET